QEGQDVVKVFIDETRALGKEVFISHRMNGSDNDLGPNDYDRIPMKIQHPDWLMLSPWSAKVWNFKFDGVREYSLSVVRELAENYPVDGIELDFTRSGMVLPPGEQWENSDKITQYVRKVRL